MTKSKENMRIYALELLELSERCKMVQEVGIHYQYIKLPTVSDIFSHSSNSDVCGCSQQQNIVGLVGELNEVVDYTRRVLIPTLLGQRETIRKQAIRISDLLWRRSRLMGLVTAYRERRASSTWRPINMLDPKEGDWVLLRSPYDIRLSYFDGYTFSYFDTNLHQEVEIRLPQIKESYDAFIIVPKFEQRLLRRSQWFNEDNRK